MLNFLLIFKDIFYQFSKEFSCYNKEMIKVIYINIFIFFFRKIINTRTINN